MRLQARDKSCSQIIALGGREGEFAGLGHRAGSWKIGKRHQPEKPVLRGCVKSGKEGLLGYACRALCTCRHCLTLRRFHMHPGTRWGRHSILRVGIGQPADHLHTIWLAEEAQMARGI